MLPALSVEGGIPGPLPELTNPHDRFFKEVFSRPETAADFLANYLPPEVVGSLNLADLQLVKDSFVDSDLQEFFSDLLYQVRLGQNQSQSAFVYVLFEHKSAPDEWVAFQLLRYMVKIWTPMARRGRLLPPIIPLVLYHGRTKWKVAKNFAALVDGGQAESLKNYVPEFEYHLCDLTQFDPDKLKGNLALRALMLVMKNVFGPDPLARLGEVLELARQLPEKDGDGLKFVMTLLLYFSVAAKGLSREDFRGAVRQAFPLQEERIMSTVAEEWVKEGIEKGIEEGIQKGIEEGRIKGRIQGKKEGRIEGIREGASALTLRQLRRRFGRISAPTRERILSLSAEDLQELGIALLDFSSQKDLSVWLAKRG
jgi:predicted transposase/invertase (TIGR01784 family)